MTKATRQALSVSDSKRCSGDARNESPTTMAITVRLSEGLEFGSKREIVFDSAPADLGALISELEQRYPGARAALDSSSVNAAVNGDVVLSGRDRTKLTDGDDVDFLIMFAGG